MIKHIDIGNCVNLGIEASSNMQYMQLTWMRSLYISVLLNHTEDFGSMLKVFSGELTCGQALC